MSISLHGVLSSNSLGNSLITLPKRNNHNFDALLPILYVMAKPIIYPFDLKLSPKCLLKIGSTCLMIIKI